MTPDPLAALRDAASNARSWAQEGSDAARCAEALERVLGLYAAWRTPTVQTFTDERSMEHAIARADCLYELHKALTEHRPSGGTTEGD